MLCESVVHNALRRQDRGNYHNQRRGSSISGEPRGVNEAEREKEREVRKMSQRGERRGMSPMFVGCPKTPRRRVRKLPPA